MTDKSLKATLKELGWKASIRTRKMAGDRKKKYLHVKWEGDGDAPRAPHQTISRFWPDAYLSSGSYMTGEFTFPARLESESNDTIIKGNPDSIPSKFEPKLEHLEYYTLYDVINSMYVYRDGEFATYSQHSDSRGWTVDPENAHHIKQVLINCSNERLEVAIAQVADFENHGSLASEAVTDEIAELEDLNNLVVVKVCQETSIEHVTKNWMGEPL